MKKFVLNSLLVVLSLNLAAQLEVTTGLTVEEYLENGFLGVGVEIVPGSVTFFGNTDNLPLSQIGLFNGENTNIGIDTGLIMMSGEVSGALGPNTTSDWTGTLGGPFNSTPDPDLDALSGFGSFDRCVVEFDFIPRGNSIEFQYVFASEEYCFWAGTVKNDVFGFFLSGPGISGPFSRNAVNLAVIPGTNTPVSVNSIHGPLPVNDERPFSQPPSFEQYYVSNGDGDCIGDPIPAPFSTDAKFIQFNGFTTPLTATADVQCGEVHHIKLAIGDSDDGFLDAGVFLKDFSSNGSGVDLSTTTPSGTDTIAEGENATITFTRTDTNLAFPLSIYYEISGTATNGADYSFIVIDSIRFPPGVTTQDVEIKSTIDFPLEGVEEVTFTAFSQDPCGNPVNVSKTIYIVDGEERLEPKVTAPDVITPNGDNFNDNLTFTDLDNTIFPESILEIFNRWGRKVYEEKGYNNTWSPEKELSDGTYYYILKLGNEAETVLKGSFTILH